ncbi:MAG: putative bifunctional diguanylate cyclase/phosphodiesterase, partial [Alphaproteobacteria bacterium]
AIEREEFLLHYQPQVDLRTGRVRAVEALVRWQHPEFGMLAPLQFVPLAEETGLIIPLGRWVLEAALRQCRAWRESGLPPLQVAVNISPRQFRDSSLASTIAAALDDAGLPPECLALELTEGTLMEDTQVGHATLSRFRDMGLYVAIDDFGTGYSSLSYLKRFPIDALKIDKSFIRDLATDSEDAAITTAMIGLAHNLRLDVIAEGVETVEQMEFLKANGCDAFQGYVHSRPMPADMLAPLLRSSNTA